MSDLSGENQSWGLENNDSSREARSKNPQTYIQSWRCSFKPSCKATINVNMDGEVIWAKNNHNHAALTPAQIQNGSPNEVLIYKNLVETARSDSIDKSKERLGSCADSESSNDHINSGTCSPQNLESGRQKEAFLGDSSEDKSVGEDNTFEDQVSTLPRLGPVFSMAGRDDMVMMSCTIKQSKRDNLGNGATIKDELALPTNVEQGIPLLTSAVSLSNPAHKERSLDKSAVGKLDSRQSNIARNCQQPKRNSESTGFYGFSVAKSTETMRNILSQAIEELRKESLDESKSDINRVPKSRERPTVKARPKQKETKGELDMQANVEEEWQWQFINRESMTEEEDDDGDINVEVSEEEEESFIDEEEMAMILGD